MSKDTGKWLSENLSNILSFPVPQDLIEYIITMENERDIEDYLKTLLDLSNPRHTQFLNNFKIIRHFGETQDTSAETASNKKQKKKKTKYMNLYENEEVLLKGRHHCDCQANKHQLINNCLKCGRIVCEQEGSGPCLFCGSLVCSREEQEKIAGQSKESRKLFQSLMELGRPEGWEEALAQRDRLLHYDQTSQRRTKVIDDEGEYYTSNSVWLSEKERAKVAAKEKELQERKHASRLDKKFTLDFAGRQIKEEQYDIIFDDEDTDELFEAVSSSFAHVNIHPDLQMKPEYIEPDDDKRWLKKEKNDKFANTGAARVQDKQLLEMSDQGLCLSLHQPYASLLVSGIMRHEGRVWYSPHRGRLWIASASKTPTESEVKEIENFFRHVRHDENLKFPLNYPTSCLVGCVTVVDCLPQEEYRLRFPDGESESPFVFLCEDAYSLSIKFPIVGQHKIYKLDSKIHYAAQKALMRLLSST